MDLSGVRRRRAAVVAELRRAVLVRRRLLSALCAAVAVLATVQTLAPPPPATRSALVAVRQLGAGEVIGAGDVATEALPAASVPDDVVSAPVGRRLAGAIGPGEVLTESRLVGASLLTGRRDELALPVRIPDAEVVGLLRVGDRVDLFAADPAAAEPVGVRLLQSALVLALPVPGGRSAEGGRGRIVVLAAAPDQVANVSGYGARGLLTVALSG